MRPTIRDSKVATDVSRKWECSARTPQGSSDPTRLMYRIVLWKKSRRNLHARGGEMTLSGRISGTATDWGPASVAWRLSWYMAGHACNLFFVLLLHFAQCLTNLKSFVLVEGGSTVTSVVPLALALRSHLKDTNAPTGQQSCLLTCELRSLFAHVFQMLLIYCSKFCVFYVFWQHNH